MRPETTEVCRATVCARETHNLELKLSRRSLSCAACNEGRGCGAGLLRFAPAQTKLTIPAESWPELDVGDSIDLHMSAHALLRLSLLGYGIPLLFFIVTVLLASFWFTEFWVSIFSVLALAAGAKVGERLARRAKIGLAPVPVATAGDP